MSDDPEIQALIACIRALEPLNQDARERAVEYIKARVDQWRIETVARQGATRREPKP